MKKRVSLIATGAFAAAACMAVQTTPVHAQASEPCLGQLMAFAGNYAPRGYAFANGATIAISSNQALFAIIGCTYGGDCRTTFALPNLQSRWPVHVGQGPGLSPVQLGQTGGSETVTLSSNQMAVHSHAAKRGRV